MKQGRAGLYALTPSTISLLLDCVRKFSIYFEISFPGARPGNCKIVCGIDSAASRCEAPERAVSFKRRPSSSCCVFATTHWPRHHRANGDGPALRGSVYVSLLLRDAAAMPLRCRCDADEPSSKVTSDNDAQVGRWFNASLFARDFTAATAVASARGIYCRFDAWRSA